VHTFYLFPFRVLYIYESPSESPLPEVLFSVSKRNFKKAVDRNLIRRRCREAYRLHKAILVQNPEARLPSSMAFLYLAKEKTAYDVIEKAMKKIILKLAENSH
jgi:ribonuclease P protein component